eukprot:7964047-Pyramimonas_sp.AAC.1
MRWCHLTFGSSSKASAICCCSISRACGTAAISGDAEASRRRARREQPDQDPQRRGRQAPAAAAPRGPRPGRKAWRSSRRRPP